MITCGVCHKPIPFPGDNRAMEKRDHPDHTEAEVAPTRTAVDAAAWPLLLLLGAQLLGDLLCR